VLTAHEAPINLRFIAGCSTGLVHTGPEGNARLTGMTAVVLLVLLAVEGLTLLSLQSFLSWHIVVGMLLVPVVLLKLASTGWRFARYYRGSPAYRETGPPVLPLRLLGPVVVAATVGLFTTGVALAVRGPGGGLLLLLHKASFVVWLGACGIHVLGHVARIPRLVMPDLRGGEGVGASRLRLGAVAAAVVAGAILAVLTVPLIGPWTHWID
jgi:hypothetical protein